MILHRRKRWRIGQSKLPNTGRRPRVKKKFQWTPYSVTCSCETKSAHLSSNCLAEERMRMTHRVVCSFHHENADEAQQEDGRGLADAPPRQPKDVEGRARASRSEGPGRDDAQGEDKGPHADIHLTRSASILTRRRAESSDTNEHTHETRPKVLAFALPSGEHGKVDCEDTVDGHDHHMSPVD